METFLLSIGWWNFIGSIMMLGFINESFGKKVLNEWTIMFKVDYSLNYWGKLWIFWAAGLNIFFGLVNIMAVRWGYKDVMIFLIITDIIAYLIFIALSIWGLRAGKCGSGIYSAFIIFSVWIVWGGMALIA